MCSLSDADGKPVYDFTITDQTFDEYKNAGVRPMVELGFMPKDLASTVPGITEYQLHYPKPTMGGSVEQSAEGLQDVGRAGAQVCRAPGAALRQG